jgi:tRNA pseudouridine38-40 synthase
MRIALGISYQGSHYHGWQTQAKAALKTIQATLETAVAKVADHPIALTCAGRTDKGVHALGQVVHFDTQAVRNERAWLLGINSQLSEDIRVDWVRAVPNEFHARFSATARRYHYVIDNKPLMSALWNKHSTHYYYPLNETPMQIAANYLIGEHDFSSFRSAACQSKTAIRAVQQLNVIRKQAFVMIDIQANAFLHHMVRNIVGVLLVVGSGKREPLWCKTVLEAKDRTQAAETAKPNGLYLIKVFYPESFAIPKPQKSFF